MTQGERATAVLNYLEGLDAKTVINILNPMLDDEVLESDEDSDGNTPEEVREALEYVRKELDEDELLIYKATVSKNLNHRMPAGEGLDDGKIIDWLEEYGADNDLPEGWWENYGDVDDWLMWL